MKHRKYITEYSISRLKLNRIPYLFLRYAYSPAAHLVLPRCLVGPGSARWAPAHGGPRAAPSGIALASPSGMVSAEGGDGGAEG